jgi:hypothetical protein
MIKNFIKKNITPPLVKPWQNKGYILIQVIVFSTIAVYILGALTNWAASDIRASKQSGSRELSIQIAEAGIDYYRWHLAHAPTDYQDGTGIAGPYVHDFYDKNDNKIGTFTLDITPPLLGSSLVIVKSTGRTNAEPNITRTIQAKFAKPSIAKYAVVTNDIMRFGEGTEIFGPIHSNKGIRFDGLIHNIITSSVAAYDDPDHIGSNNEYGVHTHISPIDPFPPIAVPSRPDVFTAGRQFPIPEVDFTVITADIAQMKADAVANGYWRANSGSLGYHITLKTNDTFDLRKVTQVYSQGSCENEKWSVKTENLLGNYPLPNNGLIFLEDNVWVNGQINSARVTIIAAVLPDNPSTRKNITINNDLLYTNYEGSDVVGLIAQNNINVGLISDDNLQIDASLIAQKGRVGRFYYDSECSNTYYKRQTLTLNGMLATAIRYGFAYTDGTGYQIRNLNYDNDLLYSPPPSFPLTSDQYITISWEEIK